MYGHAGSRLPHQRASLIVHHPLAVPMTNMVIEGDMASFSLTTFEEHIPFFAEHCDLVCVFFDPIGQALCERTMAVVEELNESCPDKVSYYCSKADTLTDAKDRQKVLIQITQNREKHTRPLAPLRLLAPSAWLCARAPPGFQRRQRRSGRCTTVADRTSTRTHMARAGPGSC